MAAKPRLTPDDWLRAGLDALAREGAASLRAEALARALGATKGSFYWHFTDVPAYQAQVLAAWSGQALDGFAALVDGPARPPAQLLRDLARAMARPDASERAVRAWAVHDGQAARVLAEVDAARRATLDALLAQLGVSNPDISQFLQAATIGMAADAPGDPVGTLVDLVLALR